MCKPANPTAPVTKARAIPVIAALVIGGLLSACTAPKDLPKGPVAKRSHTQTQEQARLDDLVGAMVTLCADGLERPAQLAAMKDGGYTPFHRTTKKPLVEVADAPVIWRKRFGEGHGGSLSLSNSNGLCSGLYQNIAFDQQSIEAGLSAGVDTIARFAEAKGYAPVTPEAKIQVIDRDPAAAFGQYEGPKGRLSVMIGYSPGEQSIQNDTLITRLGGIRFLLVADGQHI